MNLYRQILKFVQIAIVLVVLPRVADFVGTLGGNQAGFDLHDLIRYAFALTLGLGTIASSYFSDETPAPEYEEEPTHARERKRRERETAYYATMHQAAPYAQRAVLAFASLDGIFNLGDALTNAIAAGRFAVTPETALAMSTGNLQLPALLEIGSIVIFALAVVIFGLSPTILSIILAKTISMVDRIPKNYERPTQTKEIDWVRTIMGNLGWSEFGANDVRQVAAPAPAQKRPSRRRDEIFAYLDEFQAQNGRAAEFAELFEILPDPKPSKSTVSEFRREWLAQ